VFLGGPLPVACKDACLTWSHETWHQTWSHQRADSLGRRRARGVAELHGVARLVGQTLLSHWSDAHGAAHAVWAGQRGRARGAHLQHLWPAHESVGWTRGVQLHRPGQVGACPLVGVCCCLLSRQASALPLLHTSTRAQAVATRACASGQNRKMLVLRPRSLAPVHACSACETRRL
jgi:hypothetical protein